jgi:hypothetical protein
MYRRWPASNTLEILSKHVNILNEYKLSSECIKKLLQVLDSVFAEHLISLIILEKRRDLTQVLSRSWIDFMPTY